MINTWGSVLVYKYDITIFHKLKFSLSKLASCYSRTTIQTLKHESYSQRIFNGYNNQSPQNMNTATFSNHDRGLQQQQLYKEAYDNRAIITAYKVPHKLT